MNIIDAKLGDLQRFAEMSEKSDVAEKIGELRNELNEKEDYELERVDEQ